MALPPNLEAKEGDVPSGITQTRSPTAGQSMAILQPLTRASGQCMTRRLLISLLFGVISGCVYVPSVMWNRAEANRLHINDVRVGQSLVEGRAIMKKDPDNREVRGRF